ncbi:MAG: tRNA pseudouridine(13) synthase TruD, partial [Methylomonas sp.]
ATWNQAIAGDVFKLNQTNSHFHAEVVDATLLERLNSGDIHPTGALFGKGEGGVSGDALAIEQAIIMAHPELTAGLLKAGLEHDRRALRVIPEDFSWQFAADNQLKLAFRLPAGSYATGLLREIVDSRVD